MEDSVKVGKRNLVGSVGKGGGGVFVGLEKDAIAPGGDGGPGEDGGKNAIATGRGTGASGALHAVGGVEDDGVALFANPVEGTHVGDEIVVAEGGAAFGEEEIFAAVSLEFFGDITDIPGSEELAFFYVDSAPGLGGGDDEIGLTTEKGGNLQKIDGPGSDGGIAGRVDVGGHGHAVSLAEIGEELAAFVNIDPAIGSDGGAIGFIVTRLKDVAGTERTTNLIDPGSHPAEKFRGFDHARTEDEYRLAGAKREGADVTGAHEKGN